MKIVYIGTRLQVNGATKVVINHCNILYNLGHEIRLVVLGANLFGWEPIVSVEYVTSFRKVKIDDQELIVALDCFSANWFTGKYGEKRVVSFIQANEPQLYTDVKLVSAAEKSFRLSNPKIVVSKYLQDVLYEYGRTSHIIPPAADERVFYPEIRKAPEKGKPFRVLVVGSYEHPLKQIPQAYAALEYLKRLGVDIRLVRLVRKAEKETPKDIKTKWYVNPTQEEVGNIYRSVDVLLVTSSSEGFGLPILEAMMSGIPFVATDNGGSRDLVPETVKDNLINVGDIKAMGDALYHLAIDKAHWEKFSRLGLTKAKQWSWKKVAVDLEKFLHSIYKTAF